MSSIELLDSRGSSACGADFLSPFFSFAHKRRKVLPYDLLQREDHRRRSWGDYSGSFVSCTVSHAVGRSAFRV